MIQCAKCGNMVSKVYSAGIGQPQQNWCGDCWEKVAPPETLSFRDTCAIAAMQGILAGGGKELFFINGVERAIDLAAFDLADAMEAERVKRGGA